MDFTYREATVDDAPSIAHQIIASDYNPQKTAKEWEQQGYRPEEVLERTVKRWTGYISGTHTPRFGKAPRRIYLAFDNDTLAGHVACHHTAKHGCESELQSIYVLPEYQGKGLGTILLSMAVDWLVGTGVKSMVVGFYSDNPFQRFYFKYGGVKSESSGCEWHDLAELQRLLRKPRDDEPTDAGEAR